MRIKRTISLTITLMALVGMSLIIFGRQSRAQDNPTRALQAQSPDPQISNNAERMIEEAVWGMLPKNKLGRKMLKKLKVYRGTQHPHQAQQPEKLELAG